MPSSFYGQISSILDILCQVRPASVLDIGVGFGKYGVLCRELMDVTNERYHKDTWQARIDGIEGYEGYRNPVHDYIYNKIHYGKVEDVIQDIDVTYDLALMIDILEHFEKEEGEKVLDKVLGKCKMLLISVPAIPVPQTYLDNELEAHRGVWEAKDFIKYNVMISGILPMGSNNANIIVLLKGTD
jgi:hypothetical protein